MLTSAEQEVAEIAAQLIRFDTSNFGEGKSNGEIEAAFYCRDLLQEVGLEVQTFEPAPRRHSIITRIASAQPEKPALVLHGHTDVVPAQAADWTHPPFAGVIIDEVLWGRGAVDMKGMDAIILAVIREMVREGRQPARDLIVALFADEEAGGALGARWLVDHHPELFQGATEAISEVGGFSVDVAGQRAYLLQTAEKGLAWLRVIAKGTAGHGSAINENNAIANLVAALQRISAYQWPLSINPATDALFQGVAELTGLPYTRPRGAFGPNEQGNLAGQGLSAERSFLDEQGLLAEQVAALSAAFGPAAKFTAATTRNTVNLTGLEAGYKANVIPGKATATIDVRPLPGQAESVLRQLQDLAGPQVAFVPIHEDIGIEAPLDSPLVEAMTAALRSEDPEAVVLPYCLGAGTDNKSLARLGIQGYGFAPLQLPADLDFTGLFHGVDERVPVASLRFGVRVLRQLLANC